MLEKLQAALEFLTAQRAQILNAGWFLQHCWMVQVKPGGTARTNCKYWQVRSRQPIFDGKTLKHLKADQVEDYKAAIERGRQLKQIDRQIAKLQQRLTHLNSTRATTAESRSGAPQPSVPSLPPQPEFEAVPAAGRSPVRCPVPTELTTLTEQEQLVKDTLLQSHHLSQSLRQSIVLGNLTVAELSEQEQLVKDVLSRSRELRKSLREAAEINQQLRKIRPQRKEQ